MVEQVDTGDLKSPPKGYGFKSRLGYKKHMLITIDGGAGTGKSTQARLLAAYYNFDVLNTGVLYRAVALICSRMGVDPKEEHEVVPVAEYMPCPIVDGSNVFIGSHDVTQEIFSLSLSNATSLISTYPMVRKHLLPMQHEMAQQSRKRGVVTEGRDQGSVVFPEADVKFFFTAPLEVRARRRMRDMPEASYEEILADLEARDRQDSSRRHAPLEAAHDAISIDTSDKTPGGLLDLLIQHTNHAIEVLAQRADMNLRIAAAAEKNAPEHLKLQAKELIQYAEDQI